MPATLSPAIMMGEIAAAIQVCIKVELYLFFLLYRDNIQRFSVHLKIKNKISTVAGRSSAKYKKYIIFMAVFDTSKQPKC